MKQHIIIETRNRKFFASMMDLFCVLTNSNDHTHTNKVDFEYDAYGNMIKDRNKNISEITYNHLNLPKKITFTGANSGTIEYIYSANGDKLKKTVTEGANNRNTDYLDGFQYSENKLSFFPTIEGYVNVTYISGKHDLIPFFNYIYNYTDHLGNIRLRYTKDPEAEAGLKILEEDHYYPFGLKHHGYNNEHNIFYPPIGTPNKVVIVPITPDSRDPYKYKYNGKEFQDELGLDWYDYGARNYDASLGRWMNVDPLANHPRQVDKSTYAYTWNNPINLTDPDGRCPKCPDEVYVPLAEHVYTNDLKEGDVSSNGWVVERVDTNPETGYKAALYKGEYNGNTEYIYSTQGTNPTSLKDWKNNAEQVATGNSAQYAESVENAGGLTSSKDYAGVSFTGHSLGGGLASANALATNGKAVTFNAAGLSKATKSNPSLGLKNKTANISAYVVHGEIVSHLQGKIGIRAEGNITTLPASYVPQIPFTKIDNVIRTKQRIRNHMMNVMIDKFNTQKK